MSGKEKVRPLWNRYFSDTLALVWVVDSSDLASLQVCKQEFKKVIREPDLHEAVILIYLNKQDLSSGESPQGHVLLCVVNMVLRSIVTQIPLSEDNFFELKSSKVSAANCVRLDLMPLPSSVHSANLPC